MRKVGIVAGTIILILVVAVVVFAATFDVNQYRGTIQSELEKRLDRKVVFGDMHLGLFPPRLQVQNLSVADDPKFNDDMGLARKGFALDRRGSDPNPAYSRLVDDAPDAAT